MKEETMAWLLLAAPYVSKELLEECPFEPLWVATDYDYDTWVYVVEPLVPKRSEVWELENYSNSIDGDGRNFRITVITPTTPPCIGWKDTLVRIGQASSAGDFQPASQL